MRLPCARLVSCGLFVCVVPACSGASMTDAADAGTDALADGSARDGGDAGQPEDAVTAFRYNFIYGKNTAVKIVDLGLVNHTTTGLSQGLQGGLVNYTESEFSGLQLAAINYNKGTAKGLLWSGVNYAGTGGGLHIAFLNYAERMQGVQVGVLNIIKEGGAFPFMVIANWGK